jgi:SapC
MNLVSGLAGLYDRPTVLTAEWGHQRIYAAQSYKRMRELEDVPVVVPEAIQLAASFPLCWKMVGGTPVLVALRSLLPGGLGHYPDDRAQSPLVVQAYPFVIPDSNAIANQQLVVDQTVPDKPSDLGAPIVLDKGRMSRGALFRARTALHVARAIPATEDLSCDLHQWGFLEPWPLRFDLGGGRQALREDLWVISAKRLSDPRLFGTVARHGTEAGLFLGFHRVSLFRISALLQLAKAAHDRVDQPETLSL